MKRFSLSLFIVLMALQAMAQPLQRVAPEQVGMDSRQLRYADQVIKAAISDKAIPGAVLAVVRNGKMAYLKAYGNKRVYPNTEPMTVNTIFDMASCSKSMSTAVCIHILAERGSFVSSILSACTFPDLKTGLVKTGRRKDNPHCRPTDTYFRASSIRSGKELEEKYGAPNPDGLMEYIAGCKRDFKPQTGFQYSCLNYITLQHIIEKISGQSLREFARQNIFNVLGMNHTDYLPCKRDKNGHWVNTSDACWATDFAAGKKTDNLKETKERITTSQSDWHSLIAPTEKQPDGSVLCGQVHDPLARIMNGGISGNAGVFFVCRRYSSTLCGTPKWRRMEWAPYLKPFGSKSHAYCPHSNSHIGTNFRMG